MYRIKFIIFFGFGLMWSESFSQSSSDSIYTITQEILTLATPDSSFVEEYEFPQIIGLKNEAIQKEINLFLRSTFVPDNQYIKDFYRSHLDYEAAESAHWDRLEITYSIVFSSPDLICIEKSSIHEFQGMMQVQAGSSFYNIDLNSGEPYEYLYEWIKADSTSLFNDLLREADEHFKNSNIRIDVISHKGFTISKNKDSELWLEVYIPAYAEYMVSENEEIETLSNGNLPLRFKIELEKLKDILVEYFPIAN